MAAPERYPALVRRLLALLTLAACGDPSGPDPEAAAVLAVNGAALPLIAPGAALAIEGRGFGVTPGTVQLGSAALEATSWTNETVLATAPTDPTGILSVTTADGLALTRSVRAAPIDTTRTDARTWMAGADLPLGLAQASAAGIAFPDGDGYSSLIVLFGGQRADGSLSDSTWLGRVENGAVTEWAAAPDTVIPAARRLHAMVGASSLTSRLANDGVAWMIGGLDQTGRAISDVRGIAIGSTGSYGFWTPLAAMPVNRAGMAAAVGLGAIYVVGGFGNDSLAAREVLIATINTEGTINGWFRGPDLPEGRAFASTAVVGDRLYVLGGVAGAVHPDTTDLGTLRATVYSITLSRRTGFVVGTDWQVEPPLAHARARHAVFASGRGLIVVGGVTDDPTAPETEWAPLTNGALGTFAERVAATVPRGPLRDFAAPVVRDAQGRIVVTTLAGRDSTGVSAQAWWH